MSPEILLIGTIFKHCYKDMNWTEILKKGSIKLLIPNGN